MRPDSSTALDQRKYHTLVLIEACCWGWDEHVGVSPNQLRILMWIAKRGKNNETGVAFAWFPYKGQEWWGSLMGMSKTAITTALAQLRKKGLIVNLRGSADDPRYRRKRGYAIPLPVMAEAEQWAADREQMSRTLEKVTGCDLESAVGSQGVTQKVTGCDFESPTDQSGVGLSVAYPGTTRDERENPSLTDCEQQAARPQEDTPVRYQDDFDVPKDEREPDTFARPHDPEPERYHRPSTRIMTGFWSRWEKSREKRFMLSLPWTNDAIVAKQINRLRDDYSEDEINTMVTKFFAKVDAGSISLKSDELWKDFWYQRATLAKLTRQSGGVKDYTTQNAKIMEQWETS